MKQEAFVDDTAAKSGRARTAVARDATRAKAVGPDLDRVAGTALDKGAELDGLAAMPADDRALLIQVRLACLVAAFTLEFSDQPRFVGLNRLQKSSKKPQTANGRGGDRNEKIRVLAKVAIAILRRNAAGSIIALPGGGRARIYELRHNEMMLSLRQTIDDPAQTTQLEIRFDAGRVLFAEWNADGFMKRSYMPGPWERVMRRYERIVPALAGQSSTPM